MCHSDEGGSSFDRASARGKRRDSSTLGITCFPCRGMQNDPWGTCCGRATSATAMDKKGRPGQGSPFICTRDGNVRVGRSRSRSIFDIDRALIHLQSKSAPQELETPRPCELTVEVSGPTKSCTSTCASRCNSLDMPHFVGGRPGERPGTSNRRAADTRALLLFLLPRGCGEAPAENGGAAGEETGNGVAAARSGANPAVMRSKRPWFMVPPDRAMLRADEQSSDGWTSS